MELFKLFGSIAIDNSLANQSIDATNDKAKSAGISIAGLGEEGGKTSSKLGSAFSKIGSAAATVGKTIATGLAVGAAAFTGLTAKALNLTGELEQNMGGSEAVFEEYAKSMQDTAKNAFSAMGLATSDYLATANKMGALFQGAGFSIEESANLSTDTMQRAADVASIMGISTESAMEAIAGAAKGNFTMMDNLGVAMNDTAIQNYALSKGINKTTAEMTQQEKIGLAMEMFMDKTAYATGNYAKENETLAGSLGTAKAALKNFLDGSGDVDSLVDSLTNAANVIVKNLVQILPRLVTGVTELVKKLVPLIPPLLQTLLPSIVEGAVQLVNGLVEALPTVIDALIDCLPGLIDGVERIVYGLVDALPKLMRTICNALPTLLPQLITAIINMVVYLAAHFVEIIQPLIDNLPDIIIAIVDALMDNLPTLIQGCVALVIGIVQAIPQIILSLIDAIPTIVSSIVTGLWNALPVLLNGVIAMVKSIGTNLWTLFSGFGKRLDTFFAGLWDKIKNIFSGVGSWFKNIFKGAFDGIKAVFGGIGDWFKTVFDKIADVAKAPINFIIRGLNTLIKGVNEISFDVPDWVPDWVPGIGGKKFGFSIKEIPELAKGGVVNKPTQAIIGEDGEEAVVPLERNTGWIRKIAEQIRTLTVNTSTGVQNVIPTDMFQAMQQSNQVQFDRVGGLLESVVNLISEFFPEFKERMEKNVVLDDGTLVAKLTPKIDRQLGVIYKRMGRG